MKTQFLYSNGNYQIVSHLNFQLFNDPYNRFPLHLIGKFQTKGTKKLIEEINKK